MTPLYKFLKTNGTSFYAFPGAAEDISAAYQNESYRMYFSKYVLLNFPKQNIQPGSATVSKPVYWDFDNSFVKSNQSTPATSYKDQLVESLRNYVANFEVTMKESRKNSTEYYYDNTALETPTEKIFWKWCKSLNLLDLEQADNGDQYFGTLDEFATKDPNDDSYFPEILWRERIVKSFDIIRIFQSNIVQSKMEMEFSSTTNFRVGDVVKVSGYSDSGLKFLFGDAAQFKITRLVPEDTINGFNQRAIVDYTYSAGEVNSSGVSIAKIELVYHRLVEYISEVNGINNVSDKTRSYTEVYAHVPDHTGKTPDVLFRTRIDKNYKPNLVFPILPSQYQPEIVGAELFNNPIVNSPQNYPGSQYGQFDTEDFTYEAASGDSERRSGDYYGVSGDINQQVIDVANIDGLSLDFDNSHYAKMNIRDRVITNFEQFNSLQVNNQPPQDFEFNAILWYYSVEDINGNSATNLYGMSILDNPDNNTNTDEIFNGNGLRIPLYKKLAANDNQDGTSYAFSLNLNFNIINDNPQDTYNPEAINSLFSFNLFNEAMTNLASINDSFSTIVSTQNKLQEDITNLKQLLYSQSDIQLINGKISNLENLLKLYSTNQITSSGSIEVTTDTTKNPPLITLESKDTDYREIVNISTKNLYTSTGNLPFTINIPTNKNFLIYILNDDLTNLTLPNQQKLEIILNSDLSHKQSFDLVVAANDTATQNKQLDVYIKYQFSSSTPVETKLLDTIDLPVYYNSNNQQLNSAKTWDEMNFTIDLSRPMSLDTGSILEVPLNGESNLISNSIKKGDVFLLQNFNVGTVSNLDFSGQYFVTNVGTDGYVYLNVSNNIQLITYGASASLPLQFNATQSTYLLANSPTLKLNKGTKFKVTRISDSPTSEIKDRYFIQTQSY
jgi:hypothetical protein